MKAVILLDNGTIQDIFVDNKELKILVLDSDVDGCDASTTLDVGRDTYGLDAMAQSLPKVKEKKVDSYFSSIEAALKRRPREGHVDKVLGGMFDTGRPASNTLSSEDEAKIREVFSAIGIHRLDVDKESTCDDSEPCYVLSSESGTNYGSLQYSADSGQWLVIKVDTRPASKRSDVEPREVTIGRGTDPLTACAQAAQHWAGYLIEYALARVTKK